MASMLRLRKLLYLAPTVSIKDTAQPPPPPPPKMDRAKRWGCVDWCFWTVGCVCTTWWLLLFLYAILPSTLIPSPEPPGVRLRREGLHALHPVVFVPGIVTGGLELWEGRPCAEGLFRKRLWGGNSFTEIFRRPLCWMEHMSLDNETGLDPPGIRVRAVPGLVAADYFTPGYFVWARLIDNLARIGYEGKNMHMTAYDWRLSFHNTEVRDRSLSRLKSEIELMVTTNGGKKVVVVPHSMGSLYFLYFLKWVEAPQPLGGGGGPGWCAAHVKAVLNIGPTFLGVPKAVSGLFSAEARDVAFLRTMAPGLLDSNILGLQTLQHMMRVGRTWDAIHSLLPKGGEAIWGGFDWSGEEGHDYDAGNKKYEIHLPSYDKSRSGNASCGKSACEAEKRAHYGRIISFGKIASQLPSFELASADYKKLVRTDSSSTPKSSCGGVWTEYRELSQDSIKRVIENKVYTAKTIHDLLHFVAPKLMQRADAHFSYGIADNLDDPKYSDQKYWSNPLETRLPNAPETEMYCLYGVGIPTERSYVYKLSPSDRCNNIPFQIDGSADGGSGECLKGGVFLTDGDQSVPVLSAGLMCAKAWRGETRFNPSGMPTYVREYQHKPPANLLHGRGSESGAHVDIMGNTALIEDIMRVASGASGAELGGDRIHSDISKISERVKLKL